MSIFGTRMTAAEESFQAPVYEGYGCEVNGDLIALQESYEDHLNIVRAIHALDMEEIKMRGDVQQLSESAAEARIAEFETVTEGMAGDAWEKIKAFFNKLWGKLKAFYKSVVRYFDGIFKSAQDFVKKYESQLTGLELGGFEYKMFKYTNIDSFTEVDNKARLTKLRQELVGGAAGTSPEKIRQLSENRDELLAKDRAALIGGGSSLTSDQYKEALFALFRDGAKDADDKKEVAVSIRDVIATIKNTEAKKKVDAHIKSLDAEFSNLLKDINKAKEAATSAKATQGKENTHVDVNYGNLTSNDAQAHNQASSRSMTHQYQERALAAFRAYSGYYQQVKEIELDYFRAWRAAWEERNSTYKKVCLAAFRYKKKAN